MTERFADNVPSEVVHALGGRQPTMQQWEAISAPLEPCALIAGAGSGKTAVMTARMVWLIVSGHANANEILGLTFTNKAAENLRARVRAAIAPLGLSDGEEPAIATYHAFAAGMIVEHGIRVGIEPGAELLSEAQAWQLCARCYLERTYEAMEPRTLYHVGFVRNLADGCANHLVEPAEVIAYDRDLLGKIERSADRIARAVVRASERRIELAEVVDAFRRAKQERALIDYGDQIRLAHQIAQDPQVAEEFRARFRFVLLDEYQDTNVAQARMLRALMPPGYPVMAVGDPDQNIYAWRGASLRNLLAFSRDFPRADGSPAGERKLEVNFRSGARILSLANILIQGIPDVRRPPGKVLRHFPDLGKGAVAIALVGDQVAEAETIAREAKRLNAEGTPWREMTVLCRKSRLFNTLVEVFRRTDVPAEVIGLGGLLAMPEVVDLVALLRVLDDPMRNVALARILQGPRWRIGYRDLALIARHASQKNRELREALPDLDEFPVDVAFSLAEAVAALDEVDGVSDEARARLAGFNAELTALRAKTHLPLAELVADALDMLGIQRELDASPNSAAARTAARNLANFLDRVAGFEPLEGEATLSALVEWLDAIEEADEGIEAAQPSDDDSVKVMTIHQAKGLEFDVVFLPGLAASTRSKIFPDTGRQANPATSPRDLPFELRGDADVLPRFEGVLSQFEAALRDRAEEEERRLFYVAVTRARHRLVATAAHWYAPSGSQEALKFPMGPSDYWNEIRAFPDVEVLAEVELPEVNPLIERRAVRAVDWPRPANGGAGRAAPASFPDGVAAAVRAARARTTPDPTLFPAEEPPAEAVPDTLSVSGLVTYQECPKKFYWTAIRPLPRRTSAAARVGTIVHAWIERSTTRQIALIDPEEYEQRGSDDEASRIAALREVFAASRFHGREPLYTELPFALVVGERVIQGRIDAVYERPDGGWEIVDWKTGGAPEELGARSVQLDLYALAAQQIWEKRPQDLTLSFVFLGDGDTVERTVEARPADVLRNELAEALGAIGERAFEPTPSPSICRHCDFLRDCPQGRAAGAE